MTTEATCHRVDKRTSPVDLLEMYWWTCHRGNFPIWHGEDGFCPVCGAELRPDGTSGPAAAELAARLASVQEIAGEVPHNPYCDGNWEWNGNAGDVWSEGVEYGAQIVRDKLRRALADALEVDAQ